MGSIVVATFVVLILFGLILVGIGAYRHSHTLAIAGGAVLMALGVAWTLGLPTMHRAIVRAAPPMNAWVDSSRHSVRFVEVAPDVSLEVLDWGGSGPPLVFLSGLQDVAHGFDDFAPQFTDQYHVIGITRRGYGASSQSSTGYDVATRVADVVAVLDTLGLGRVALVGHSIAGDELTGLAVAHPERVSHLVYLDAVYDHSGILTLLAGSPPPPPMLAADSASPAAVQAYLLRSFGMRIPEAQLRAIGRYDAAGRLTADVTPSVIDSLMLVGVGHPHYAAIQAPALAINSVVDSMPNVFPFWKDMSPENRAQALKFTATLQEWAASRTAAAVRELPALQLLQLHGANHYVFDSNPAEVTAAMRQFLSGNASQGRPTS